MVSSTIKGKTVEQSADLDISAGIIDGPCAPGIITTGSSTLDVVWGPDDPGCDYQHAQTQRTVATVLLNNVSYRRAGQTLTLRNSYGYQLIAQSIRKFLKDSHSPVIAR